MTLKIENKKIKIFLNYAIPSIVAMWVFSIYTMVDGMFVANFVGPSALASVNIAMPTINLIFAISLIFSTGVSTIVAINFGKGNINEANKIFTLNTIILCLISFLITTISIANLDSLVKFLGATENTVVMIKDYLHIIIIFCVFFIVSYQFEVLVKTDGAPKLATVGVIASALTNILLDYIFIAKFGWGIKGAALATGLSQVTSTIIFLSYFLSKKSKLKFVKFNFVLSELNLYKRIVAIGVSDGITEFSTGIIVFIFNKAILSIIGESGIVTYTIISYANLLVLMTMIGITQGMQPLVSYYYGKKDRETYIKFLKMAVIMVASCSVAISYLSLFHTGDIVAAFIGRNDIELFNYSVNAFRLFSISFLFVGFNVVISGYFAAVEKPKRAIIISISRGLIVLGVCLFFMIILLGEVGIWLAPVVSEVFVLLFSFFSYLNMRKKDNNNVDTSLTY